MNVQNNKINAINNNMLLESISRDINYGINKKPDMDGLKNINLGMVEKPFFNSDDIKLDINTNLLGQNNLKDVVQEQINTIKNNNVFNSKNVANIVSMKYTNNNGKVNSELVKTNLENEGNNKVKVNQVRRNVPGEEEVVKSFTIDLDSDNELESNNTIERNNNSHIVDVVDVDEDREIMAPSDHKMSSSFNDVIKTMDSNKILTFGILAVLVIILVVYLVRCKCKTKLRRK